MNKLNLIIKLSMIIYQGTADNWPGKHPYRDLASAPATDLQALPRIESLMEQSGNVEEDTAPAPVSPRRSQPQQARGRRRRRSERTVLVVDDEESVRETLVEVLNIHGYRAITAASVAEAEQAKERLGIEAINLVITDVHLTPGRQVRAGYALAQRWRAQQPRLPFILMSGDPSNQDLPEVRGGTLRFLLKPFRIEALLEAVREALQR